VGAAGLLKARGMRQSKINHGGGRARLITIK